MEKDPGNNCTNERYWVDTLACVRIGWQDDDGEWHASAYLAPFDDDHVTPGDLVKVMVATIPCVYDAEGNPHPPPECGTQPGWTTGEVPGPGDVKAVSLIK